MNKYIGIISKKSSILKGVLLLILSSCSINVLDETPLDFLAPENAYNNIEGIRQGITGLHLSN
jgi:hypothetical protein